MYNSHYVNYNYFNTFNFKNSKSYDNQSLGGPGNDIITKKQKRIRLEQTSNYNTQNSGNIKDKSLVNADDVVAKKIKRNRFDNTINFDDLQQTFAPDISDMSYVQQFFASTIFGQQQNDLTKSLSELNVFTKKIENNENLQIIQVSSTDANLIASDLAQLVHEIENDQYLLLVCLTPLSVYIFVRSEPEKIKLNSKQFFSIFFIVILISSSTITSFSTYDNYNWMAFGESDSSHNYTKLSHISQNRSSTVSFSYSNATISPIPTTFWNFTTISKTLSVGKTRIDNSTNTTSLSLDGNGYLKQNVNATKNLSALTLSAWVKPDYSHGSSQFTVISKENTFILAINNNIVPSKKAVFSVFDGIKWNTVTSNSTIPESWTHLVATYDNSSIGIYVNGILESKIPLVGVPTISITGKIENQTGIISSSNSDVVIGAYLNSLRSRSSNLFSGSIQDVTLYNSTLDVMQINKIYLQNVPVFNPSYSSNNTTSNSPVIINSQLNHTYIEINKPVTWIQNVTLSKTTNLAIEIPSDAKILDVNSTNPESKSVTNISKFQTLNQTFNANTTIIFNKIVPVASLNPQMIEANKTSKLLVLNDTTKQYQLKFQTPAPYTLETNKSSSDQYIKQVRVLNNSTLHYLNVKSYTILPLDLVKKGIHFKLFWIINGTKTDVTNDPRFHVQFVDTNGDGLIDQMQWIVPHLSEQDFQVEEDNHGNNHDCNNNNNNDNNNGNGEDNGNGSSNHENNNDGNGDNNNQDCSSQQFSIQLSETVGISDDRTTHTNRSISLEENLRISDTITAPTTIKNISLEENLGISDAVTTPSTRNVSLEENLGVSDALPSVLHLSTNQQLVGNTQKEIVINSTKTDLVITSSNANLTTITISSTVVAPTLNYSSIVKTNSTSSTVYIVNGLTILQNTTGSIPKIQVILPSDLVMTSTASWNGVLNLPHVISAPPIPTQANTVNTVTTAIEIGSDNVSLTFNKAVRLVFAGQTGQHAGYFSSTIPFTEITAVCSDDTQITNNNLPLGGACKINSGSDLVIWTKHFTGFATWSSSTVFTPASTQAPAPTSSYGGGGGSGTGIETGISSTLTNNVEYAGPYLQIQKVSYDVCDKQILKIQVATDAKNDPMVIVRTSLVGVMNANLAQDQPYAQENTNSTIRKLVYESLVPKQEKSLEILALDEIGHNVFSVGKTIEITGCQEDLDYTKSNLEYTAVDLSAPKIFDVKFQAGNNTKISSDGQSQYIDNKPITVYSIIDTKTPIKHATLRFVKLGQNEYKYDEVSMDIAPLLISNSTYTVSGTIPASMVLSPAIKYWIHVENQDKPVDSTQYELAIKPQYAIAGKMDLYVVSNRIGGTVATPTAFFTNNSTGPIYGSVTLIVDGNPVYESQLHMFDTGLTKVNLQWNSPSTDKILPHNMQAQAKFYNKTISSQQFTMNTFPSTKTVSVSNLVNIQSMVDNKGNVMAVPGNLYSSHLHETGLSFRVTAPDGTCVIGNNCLVNKSTYTLSDQVMQITIGEQIYRIRYSGPDATLERFTISSVDPILGHWNVELESNGGIIPQAQAMEKIPLKIKYHISDMSGLQ
jgi:hypothetical protein